MLVSSRSYLPVLPFSLEEIRKRSSFPSPHSLGCYLLLAGTESCRAGCMRLFRGLEGYVPPPEMRWNSAWVVKEKETEFKRFIDEAFAEMLKSGEMKRIVERYGMPFFPPLEN